MSKGERTKEWMRDGKIRRTGEQRERRRVIEGASMMRRSKTRKSEGRADAEVILNMRTC